jgi:hypothetical protein
MTTSEYCNSFDDGLHDIALLLHRLAGELVVNLAFTSKSSSSFWILSDTPPIYEYQIYSNNYPVQTILLFDFSFGAQKIPLVLLQHGHGVARFFSLCLDHTKLDAFNFFY